jgi:hypothetical protein
LAANMARQVALRLIAGQTTAAEKAMAMFASCQYRTSAASATLGQRYYSGTCTCVTRSD